MSATPPPKPPGAGRSSHELIDDTRFFDRLALSEGMTLLDVACGPGAYSLAAAERLGAAGQVYSIDLWPAGIRELERQLAARDIQNVSTFVGDVSIRIPLDDDSVDVCLLAAVLHDFVEAGNAAAVLAEIRRVLKPAGRLTVVEFNKTDGPGPPLNIRLGPAEVADLLSPYGFEFISTGDIGPHNYLSIFSGSSNSVIP